MCCPHISVDWGWWWWCRWCYWLVMTKDDVEYFRAFGRVICACCSRRIKRPYRAGVTRSRLPRLTQVKSESGNWGESWESENSGWAAKWSRVSLTPFSLLNEYFRPNSPPSHHPVMHVITQQERKKERISHNQATLSPLLVWVSLLTPHSNTSLTHSLVLIALKKGMKYCIRCERFHPTFVWKNDFHQDEHPSFSSTHGPTPNEHQVEGERRKLARLFGSHPATTHTYLYGPSLHRPPHNDDMKYYLITEKKRWERGWRWRCWWTNLRRAYIHKNSSWKSASRFATLYLFKFSFQLFGIIFFPPRAFRREEEAKEEKN